MSGRIGKAQSVLIAFVAYVLVYLMPLGARPLVVPDESRYAEIPREMLVTGEWVAPYLNGLRYFEKPVFGYWANAAAIKVFGENNFSLRLPAALAAGAAALMLFLFVSRATGDGAFAFLCAAAMLGTVQVFSAGVFNVLDSLFSCFVTATMVLFFLAYRSERGGARFGWLAVAGAAAGFGFMTKGFLAFALPAVAIGPFLLWERRVGEWSRLVWAPALSCLAVAAPWAIAVHLREPDYWHYFFWIEHVKRFAAEDAQHAKAFWYYIPVLLGGLLPLTCGVGAAVAGGTRSGVAKDAPWRFALCWFLFPFLLLSYAKGKLPTYILPCYPPLVFLMVSGIRAYLSSGARRVFDLPVRAFALLLVLVAAAGLFWAESGWPVASLFRAGEGWKAGVAAAGFFSWAVVAWAAACAAAPKAKVWLLSVSPLLCMMVLPFTVPADLPNGHTPDEFLSRAKALVPPEAMVVSNDRLAHAVCWHLDRRDIYLLGKIGEFEYGLQYAPERVFTSESFTRMIQDPSRSKTVFLVMHRGAFRRHADSIPVPVVVLDDPEFIVARYDAVPPKAVGGDPGKEAP